MVRSERDDRTAASRGEGEVERLPILAPVHVALLLSLVAGLRGWFFLRFGVSGGEMWVAAAAILLVCAAVLRYWAQYSRPRIE